jgi:aryl-phospho-beta-D-glucosidase BglC (GH1 family)
MLLLFDSREFAMKIVAFMVPILASAVCFAQTSDKPLTAKDAMKQMGRGIAIGNTLEPPNEGVWNNPRMKEKYFDDIKKAGFTCVRLPIRWDSHTGTNAPYDINFGWFNRAEKIIDWALSRDLFVVIDAHHEQWIKDNYKDQSARDRFDSIWRQLSARFKDKSPKLIFEILNDPGSLSKEEVDELNSRILKIIRETNPTRLVMFTSHVWPSPDQVLDAAIPKDDYVMGTLSLFGPPESGADGKGSWGSDADKEAIKIFFDKISKWSEEHNAPLFLREFGSSSKTNQDSRMQYYKTCVEEAVKHGIPFTAWDDGNEYKIYIRDKGDWSEVKDILINTAAPAAH